MPITRLLVANRGEVAIRIARAAADAGIATVAVYAEDDEGCLHVRRADTARALSGRGARAYLDADQLLAIARDTRCDAVHPGYGFLAEHPMFAERVLAAGLVFVGPRPETLALLGDKIAARALAARLDVPVLRATKGGLDDARTFLASLAGAGVMVKPSRAGGGAECGSRATPRRSRGHGALAPRRRPRSARRSTSGSC
jgi:acetyl/propionyl-CoA carboxylase alpha subunit